MKNKTIEAVILLKCSPCGNDCRGRQWKNQDKGKGICVECIESMRFHDVETEFEIEENYGIEGYNFFSLDKKEEV